MNDGEATKAISFTPTPAAKLYWLMAGYPKTGRNNEHEALLLVLPILAEQETEEPRYEGETDLHYYQRLVNHYTDTVKREAYSGIMGTFLWLIARYAVRQIVAWWVTRVFVLKQPWNYRE